MWLILAGFDEGIISTHIMSTPACVGLLSVSQEQEADLRFRCFLRHAMAGVCQLLSPYKYGLEQLRSFFKRHGCQEWMVNDYLVPVALHPLGG